jgi:hypothetical protein
MFTGLAANQPPISRWDIIGRVNPRKGRPIKRLEPRRRRTSAGLRQDRIRPPAEVDEIPVFEAAILAPPNASRRDFALADHLRQVV